MKKTIDGWLARDKKGYLIYFESCFLPKYSKEIGDWIADGMFETEYGSFFPDISVPELTFENSPKKCTITIEIDE